MDVFENEFLTVSYNPKNQILTAVWTSATKQMTDAGFQESIQEGVWKNIGRYKPIGFIGDVQQFSFIINPKLQKWYGTNISSVFGTHTKKIAMIMSQDFISQFSVEEAIEEDNQSGFVTRYVSDETEAFIWLQTN